MAVKTFISFNYYDKALVYNIKSFFQDYGGKVQGKPVFITKDLTGQPDNFIDNEIIVNLSLCEAVLFLIGDNNHNSPWINREAELAISMNKAIFAIQLPEKKGALPHKFKNIKMIGWSEDEIADNLNRV